MYQRRWVVDNERRLIIIISRVTEHPSAPTKPGIYRYREDLILLLLMLNNVDSIYKCDYR